MNRSTAMTRRLHVLLLLGLFLLASVTIPACADPVGPSARDRQIARTVSFLLPRQHISQHPLDEEMSRRAMDLFLESLDPMKLYLTQADVDRFMEKRDQLGELAKQGDVSPAFDVFQTYLKRVDERVDLALELLQQDFDFTLDEEFIREPKLLDYPQDAAEIRDRWRKRIKLDLLRLQVDDEALTGQEAVEKLKRRYTSYADRMHQIDNEELLEMYLTALCEAYDPHTGYMSPETLENFEINMRLELEGIGASLQSEDGYTIVRSLVPGGAADKDGRLKPGDKIVGVGQGENGEIEDVINMKLSDVVQKIRGERGTVVRLEVIPAEGRAHEIIDITREKIELSDSEAQGKVFEVGSRPDGDAYKIGVVNLPSFYMDMAGARMGLPNYRSTTRDVRNILEDFKSQGVDAVVLDLRRNGGGSLQEAINLTGLFIEGGPVVQVKDSNDRVIVYDDEDTDVVWSGPLVTIISKFSASASEIFAGAIQDYRRGVIVGDETTHGKGTVQSLVDLGQELFRIPNSPKLGALKITIQQFYRPDGDSTQSRGVLADIQLPSLSNHLEGIAESDLEYAVEFDRVDPAAYRPVNDVDEAMLSYLRKRSAARVEESSDFQRVKREIEQYVAQRERDTITLNKEKFLAEMKKLNADEKEQEQLKVIAGAGQNGIKRDYYLDEVLAIAVDLLRYRVLAQAR